MKHTRVADLMTGEVFSVTPDTPFRGIAKLLAQHDVSGVPVVDGEDRLVGSVTRRDLLRVFLRPDAEIRRRVGEVPGDAAEVPDGDVEVHVVDGVVTLDGTAARSSRLRPLLGLVERLDGVVAVAPRVTALSDGTAGAPAGRTRQALPW
ncbi:HPP family protein [Streptomyces toxytricini]|uniref:HPP family protein n=1 Tax=Streptomyces toxytricini TaxID=67369 RepID=A0ABW8EQY2_STRT5